MLRRAAVIALSLLLVLAATAGAAKPKKGKTYSGTLAAPRNTITVSFKVAKTGKKVSKLTISDVPIFCSGGGQPIPIKFKSAKISHGKFHSTGEQIISTGPLQGQVGAKLTITGKFKSKGREGGTVTTTNKNAPECAGSTTYTTTAG